mmetsp:Transcript_47925/g.120947  ORF Transcript_47925/g.120947 Transcript_47925/m.120947 type:complete len:866 (-) Transcript_47925:31-2628(-)
MGGKRGTEWENLLQQSSDLLARDGQGLPWVQRDLLQVEEYSARLKGRTSRIGASEARIAATRLLAAEGLNSSRLARELDVFELKPSYEDVFQVETASVAEYLTQVHDMTLLTSIQQAQRDSVTAFEDFMDQCMEMDWAADKHSLFEALLAAGLSSASRTTSYANSMLGSPHLAGTPLGSRLAFAASPGASPFAGRSAASLPPTPMTGSAAPTPGAAELQLEPRAKAYLEVVKAMQGAAARGQPYNAVAGFAKACEGAEAARPRGGAVTMSDCWALLQRMVGKLEGAAPSLRGAGATTSALLLGARQHLEAGHSQYIQAVIQKNVTAARLGGSPSLLERVRALLRVMLKDEGVLDFDGGSVPTTWRQIYYCIRSGFYSEAQQVAAGVTDFRAGDFQQALFQQALGAWLEGGAVGDDRLVAQLGVECKKMLADRSRSLTSGPEARQKLLVLALLAGDRSAADQLLRDAPGLFATIEDFMWFRIAIIRPEADKSLAASTVGRAVYTLSDLQEYLCKYPSSHYSKGGKEPLLYAMVLMLSLQFRQAVTFLTKEPAAQAHRLDAQHLAAALVYHKLTDAGGASDAGARGRGVDFGALLHEYAQHFVSAEPKIALEYYMLAARAREAAGERLLKAQGALLRELLLRSQDFTLLDEGGPLAHYLPSTAAHHELLEQVAHECQLAAQLDEAVELYLAAKRPTAALAIINRRISNLMEDDARGAGAAVKAMEDLIVRGHAAAERIGTRLDNLTERREVEAFGQLLHVRGVISLSSQAQHAAAAQKLSELQFVPLEMYRVEKCALDVSSLHQVVADRVPQLLLAAAKSLRLQYDASKSAPLRSQLEAVRAFAGNTGIHYKFPASAYQELARLCMV